MLPKKSPFILWLILFTLMLAACLPPPGGPQPAGPPVSQQGQPSQPPESPPPGGGPGPAGQPSERQQLAGQQGQPGQPPEGPPPGGEQEQADQPANEPPAAGQESQPAAVSAAATAGGYPIVDTGQANCYDNQSAISCPQAGGAFYGQDAQYAGLQPRYQDNGDGTITDLNTGLMWQQNPDLTNKSTYAQAVAGAGTFNLAGYNDWRLPTIKELYSLIDFNGSSFAQIPYLDTNYFAFRFGDESRGERTIDAQYWSSTEYIGAVFGGQAAVFGVNFADGRIKGYPRDTGPGGAPMTQFVRYVRGNPDYGRNNFVDNGDGTITDRAAGLMWQQGDSGTTMNWESALAYCENLEYGGYNDWRLPNAKELQSIVDYTHAPDAQNPAARGPAIDPIFGLTEGESWFWSSTTHLDGPMPSTAVYLAFGQAYGVLNGNLVNVHGAGAQRSDPKSGNPADWAGGHGPQSDEIRIYNYARCLRNGAEFVQVTGSGANGSGQLPAGSQPPGGEQSAPTGQSPTGGTPPQEAIDACSGLSENATCEFSTPRGNVSGACLSIANQLACVPEGGPPGDSP